MPLDSIHRKIPTLAFFARPLLRSSTKKRKKKTTRKCARLTNIGKNIWALPRATPSDRRGVIARHVDDRTKGKVNEISNCFAFVTTRTFFFSTFSPPDKKKRNSIFHRVRAWNEGSLCFTWSRTKRPKLNLPRSVQQQPYNKQQQQKQQTTAGCCDQWQVAPLLSGTGNWCGTTSQDVSLLSLCFPLRRDYLILALIAERTKCDATYLLTIANLLHDLRAALVISWPSRILTRPVRPEKRTNAFSIPSERSRNRFFSIPSNYAKPG